MERSGLTDLVERGIAAVRSGDKLTARGLLVRAVQADPADVDAWMWLSVAVDTDEERLACLTQILAIDPSHDVARRGAAALRQKGVGLPSSAVGGLAGEEMASVEGLASLDHARAFAQLEPRKRHALRGFSSLIREQLQSGRKRRQVVEELVIRGFPNAAVEELVDEIARPLNRINLKRYRKQVLRGGLVVLAALLGICLLGLAAVDLAVIYFVLLGVILVGVIDFVGGLIGWVWHRI